MYINYLQPDLWSELLQPIMPQQEPTLPMLPLLKVHSSPFPQSVLIIVLERAKIMAWNSAATVLGFICGPAFSLVTAIPSLAFQFNIGSFTVYFNEYTASGWISALFGLMGLFAMIPFKEVKKPIASTPQAAMLKDASSKTQPPFSN